MNYLVYIKAQDGYTELYTNLDESEAREMYNEADLMEEVAHLVVIRGEVIAELMDDTFYE